MKRAVLVALAAVVAVSGCTGEELATEQDIQDQSLELKQHTEEQLEKDNNLVREYVINDIEFEGVCGNYTSQRFLRDSHVYERDRGIQEFQGGSYLVRNGIDLGDIDFPDCGFDMEVRSLSLESVSYNKTVFQNGSIISSVSDTCYGYEIASPDDTLSNEDRSEYHDWLNWIPKVIYEDCLGMPVDSWKPIGGEDH